MKNLIRLSSLVAFLVLVNPIYGQYRTGFRFRGLISGKNDQIFIRSNINIGDTVSGYLLYKVNLSATDSTDIPKTKYYSDTLSPPNLFLKVKSLEVTGHPIWINQLYAVENGKPSISNVGDRFLINHRGVIYSDGGRYPVTSETNFRFTFEDKSGTSWDDCKIPEFLERYKFNKKTIIFEGNGITSSDKEGSFLYNVNLFEITPYNVVTSVVDIEKTIQFDISPNPSTTGLFHIEADTQPTQWEVYNARGEQVFAPIISTPSNYTLDLSLFPKGIYLLVMHINGKTVTKKIGKE